MGLLYINGNNTCQVGMNGSLINEAYINGKQVVQGFCNVVEPDYGSMYFTVRIAGTTSQEYTLVISAGTDTVLPARSISYQVNDSPVWIEGQYDASDGLYMTITGLTAGDTVRFSGDAGSWGYFNTEEAPSHSNSGLRIYVLGSGGVQAGFEAYGNITSLLYGTPRTVLASGYTAHFVNLFRNSGILSAGNLVMPSNIRTSSCAFMFYECSSLLDTPELPAEILQPYCYYCMFTRCTSLTKAPDLPAATLPGECYQYMFEGCTNLNYIRCLSTSGMSVEYSTNNWMNGVSASGTFVKNPNAGVSEYYPFDTRWQTGIHGIPNGWSIVNNQS